MIMPDAIMQLPGAKKEFVVWILAYKVHPKCMLNHSVVIILPTDLNERFIVFINVSDERVSG